jgi:hypothetical protein
MRIPTPSPLLKTLGSMEAFLVQVVLYLLLWLWDDYLAAVLSLIFGGIALSVLLLAKVTEWIEPSNAPKAYYRLMVVFSLAPLVAAVLGLLLGRGVSWLE